MVNIKNRIPVYTFKLSKLLGREAWIGYNPITGDMRIEVEGYERYHLFNAHNVIRKGGEKMLIIDTIKEES